MIDIDKLTDGFDFSGYESPIKMFQNHIRMQVENDIMKAVQNVGVLVDKDELLKALKYDREQYEKGYRDGLNANKLIQCSYRLPEINGQYLCQIKGSLKNAYFDVFCFSDDLYSVDEYDFYKYRGKKKKSGFYDYDSECGYFEVRGVVAWMPLPEPYKEEGAG